mgnify:CR=1 FL=1
MPTIWVLIFCFLGSAIRPPECWEILECVLAFAFLQPIVFCVWHRRVVIYSFMDAFATIDVILVDSWMEDNYSSVSHYIGFSLGYIFCFPSVKWVWRLLLYDWLLCFYMLFLMIMQEAWHVLWWSFRCIYSDISNEIGCFATPRKIQKKSFWISGCQC